jgi:hypothetical protein
MAAWLRTTFKRSIGIHLGPCAAEVIQHPDVTSEVDVDLRQVFRQSARHPPSKDARNRVRDTQVEVTHGLTGLEIEGSNVPYLLSIRIEEIKKSVVAWPHELLEKGVLAKGFPSIPAKRRK